MWCTCDPVSRRKLYGNSEDIQKGGVSYNATKGITGFGIECQLGLKSSNGVNGP